VLFRSYRLNHAARWHDGRPITAEDVVWSFEVTKANNPSQAFYYQHVVKAEASGEREVTFTFDQAGNRELPHIVGQLTVLPKHWWTGTGVDGKPRSIEETTLEPPLGSGPYRVKSFEAGRTVVYERVADYWGRQLPTHVGADNFDEIRYEYFRDETVELEAFKGDGYDVRIESSAKNWATAYEFPARKEGRVVLDKIPELGKGVMVGFIPNLRRERFKDVRVREALSLALPFEDMNRTMFFGQYERVSSYFYPTELGARGLPEGAELEILKEAEKAGPIPPQVYTTAFVPPAAADPQAERANLKKALDLFAAAGWTNKGGKLTDAKGEPFRIEFLISSPAFERVGVRWREQLAKIGVELTIRSVDSSQYVNRVRNRDYDVIYSGWGESLSPGNEQFNYFGSEAADRDGSQNYAGIRNPAVDALIKRVVFAHDRAELVAASRALDRVLLWNHYVVPGWTLAATRMARWDRFAHPEPLPAYSTGFPAIWWYDAEKAAKTGAAK
jgi:microcin C transport system substrate-binding protein